MTAQQEIFGEAPVALYRLFNAPGELLYVGITDNPRARFAEHSKEKPWWPDVARKTVAWCDDLTAAIAAEKVAIKDENPLHNVRGKGGRNRGRHKYAPIAYRPPDDVRDLLLREREQADRPANAIITEALREFLDRWDAAQQASDR